MCIQIVNSDKQNSADYEKYKKFIIHIEININGKKYLPKFIICALIGKIKRRKKQYTVLSNYGTQVRLNKYKCRVIIIDY